MNHNDTLQEKIYVHKYTQSAQLNIYYHALNDKITF